MGWGGSLPQIPRKPWRPTRAGGILGLLWAPWGTLGPPWPPLGPPWLPLGPPWLPLGVFGSLWNDFGLPLALLRVPLAHLWEVFGIPFGRLGLPWGVLWILLKIGCHFPSKCGQSTAPAHKNKPPRILQRIFSDPPDLLGSTGNAVILGWSHPGFHTRRGPG